MAQTAAHLADHVILHIPVRQWVWCLPFRLPIPLRLLLAAQPKLVTPVLQVVHRVITRFLLDQAGLRAEQAEGGAVTLIQRFGSAANLNIHLHCLVLDGVYQRTDGEPVFVEVPAPSDEVLQALLHKIIGRLMKLLTRHGVLVEEEGSRYLADGDAESDEARTLRPLQTAAGGSMHLPPCLRPALRTEGIHGARRDAARRGIHPNAVCRRAGIQPARGGT